MVLNKVEHYPSDGSRYDGKWVENARDGKGEQIFPNGDIYVGDWAEVPSIGFYIF